MVDLFWAFESARTRDAGALPPEPLDLPYRQSPHPRVRELPRAVALGRPVTPADCGPVRVIAQYGFAVRCPGEVVLRRAEQPSRDRWFGTRAAGFGLADLAGDPWPVGDSGLVASWLGGSEYVKVQTGVLIYFPTDFYLYQGPLPNPTIADVPPAEVMAGVEYPSRQRLRDIDGVPHGWSSISVIVRLPPPGRTVRIARGDLLCWLFPVLSRPALKLSRLDTGATGQRVSHG